MRPPGFRAYRPWRPSIPYGFLRVAGWGDEIIAEGKARWSEESFFKEGKHQFDLAQFAFRTALGLDRWVLLVFLAIPYRETGMTLEACAALALMTVMPSVHLNRLLRTFSKNEEFPHQHSYSLRYARCNS